MNTQYSVTVTTRYSLIENQIFLDERKARDFYADCLVKYPTCNVDLIISHTV